MTSWRSKLVLLLRVALGAVFLYASWTKLSEPWALFAMNVDAYGVLPQWAVIVVARTLPWAEALIGALLIWGRWLPRTAMAAFFLLLGFFVLMARSYAAGMQIDCGCFGAGDTLSWRTLARDGLLVALAATLATFAAKMVRSPDRSEPRPLR